LRGNLTLACAICEERKEKRFCPAVHGKICPQCCGEQREVTLDCPSDCPYLQQAREHANAHTELSSNRDLETWFSELEIPDLEVSEQFLYEREELILGLSFALAKTARADRSLVDRSLMDRDLIAALAALIKTYHTMVNSGLIYEPPTANLAHQAVVRNVAREVETMVREFREAEQQHTGHTRLGDSDVVKALVFLLRLGLGRTSGRPKSRAFVDFLLAQFPEKHSALIGPEEPASRIVIP
jgi:hypothetical protein